MHGEEASPLRRLAAITALGVAALLTGPTAKAVNFEETLGDAVDHSDGKDVKRFSGCVQGGGSILVSTRAVDPNSFVRHAEAAMVDTNGVLQWRHQYQVEDQSTIATAVIPVPKVGDWSEGFVITGQRSGPTTKAFVMKIGCDGKVQWTTVLNSLNTLPGRGIANDLAVLKAGSGAAIGIVAVGSYSFIDSSSVPSYVRYHGRVTRLGFDGSVTWDRTLIRTDNSAGIQLRAVDALPVANDIHIVVAGSTSTGTSWQTDRRALFFRLPLSTMIGCVAYLGDPDDTANDDFNGIDAMMDGRIGLVGTTQNGNLPRNVLLARVNANACNFGLVRGWSVAGESITGEDIVETLGTAGQSAGLAITGDLTAQLGGNSSHISAVNVATLNPTLVHQRYGTAGMEETWLRGLDVFGTRLLAAGTREDIGAQDGEKLYLVATDPAFATMCSHDYTPTPVTLIYDHIQYQYTPPSGPGGYQATWSDKEPVTYQNYCCAPGAG